jgi:hypothetical protein
MTLNRSLSLAAAAALLAAPAAAQVPLTPRALGLGNGYVAAARGSESIWQNPANLGLPGTPHWSFTVPALAVGADILGLSVGDVRDIIDYDSQDDARKEEILSDIPDAGTSVRGELRVPLVAAQVRHFGLGVSFNSVGMQFVEKDFVDLLLFGFQPASRGIPTVNVLGSQGRRASYVDVAGSYGRRLPLSSITGALTAGVTVHYYHGMGNVRSAIVDVDTVRTALGVPTDLRVTYAGVQDKGGSGFGVDVGAAFQPMPNLTFSASVSNLANSFDFGGDRSIKRVALTSADYNNGDFQSVLDRYNESEADFVESSATQGELALAQALGFRSELPRTLRLGAAFEPRPGTQLTAGYTDELTETTIGGLWDRSLGAGVEQRVRFLSARLGLASDMDGGTLLSGGLSLGPLHLGVARLNSGSENGFDQKGWVASFGLGTASRTTMP